MGIVGKRHSNREADRGRVPKGQTELEYQRGRQRQSSRVVQRWREEK